MLVPQARSALSTDSPRSRPACRPILRADAASQPHLIHRRAPGCLLRRQEPALQTTLPSAWGREQATQKPPSTTMHRAVPRVPRHRSIVPLIHLPARCRGGRFEVREGQHRNPRDLGLSSTRRFLAVMVAAPPFFLSRRGRQGWLPRPPSPPGLQEGSPLRQTLCCPPPEHRV